MPSNNISLVTVIPFAGIFTALNFVVASSAYSQEVSDVYAPIDCQVGVDCHDVGESRLLRTGDGISINIVTSELVNEDAYTVWWIVFNNPIECAGSCGLDDLADEDVNATIQWATGDIVDKFGVGRFTAHLNEGETTPSGPVFDLPGDDVGLVDAIVAEVHVIIRSHGPAVAEQLNEQITSFDGGCDLDVAPDIPNKKGECADVQFAVHTP